MVRLWSISRNTFLQTIRQPIYMVLVLLTFAALVINLPFTGWTLSTDFHESDQQMLEDLGLGTLRVSGLLIAAFSASGVLRREIEEKTALIVISKPVSRAVFVLGKFVGVALAVGVAYYLCSLVFLMTVRHRVMPAAYDKPDWPVIVIGLSAFALVILITLLGNLFFGWPFTSTGVRTAVAVLTAAMILIGLIGKQWQLIRFGRGIPAQLLLELIMMFMAVVIFVALAVTTSARLGQAMTLLVCGAAFFVGSLHPVIIGRWALALAPILGALAIFAAVEAAPTGRAGQIVTLGLCVALFSAFFVVAAAPGVLDAAGRLHSSIARALGTPGRVKAAYLLMAMLLAALVAVLAWAVTPRKHVPVAMALVACAAVFTVFSVGRGQLIAGTPGEQALPARLTGWITPNFTHFYPQDDMRLETGVPLSLLGLAALYCLLYTAGILGLGVGLFQTRELESQTASATLPALVSLLAWAGRAGAVAAAAGALAMLVLPGYAAPAGFAYAMLLFVAAAAAWVVWGDFARGRKWSYWAVLAVGMLAIPAGVVTLLASERLPAGEVGTPVLIFAAAAVAAAVLIILVLPKTRRHFQFAAR